MADRVRFFTLYVTSLCLGDGGVKTCLNEHIESPTQAQQDALVRRAREHARRTGHEVSVERGQTAGV